MRSRARLRLSDGRTVEVGHGDLVGRLWSAAVCLDDPRISEAHALVSLRGPTLRLLGLRGRFAVEGRPLTEVDLRPGLRVSLAEDLELLVEEVEVPEEVLGITTEGMPPRALPGTCALVGDPVPGLGPPTHPGALALLWTVAGGWRIRPVGGAPRPWGPGDRVELAGRVWTAVQVPTGGRSEPTRADPLVEGPLRIVARYDAVHLYRRDREPLVLRGLSARLVSELVAFGHAVPWTVLVAELWPEGGTRKQLDMALVRLRSRLREARVRVDLVRADGSGHVELALGPDDVVEDQV